MVESGYDLSENHWTAKKYVDPDNYTSADDYEE